MTIERIIKRARRMGRIKNGFVLCDNCDTPASKEYSTALSWTACGGCATGESDEVRPEDFIRVPEEDQI
jgi:hypothetical protein